MNPIQKPLAASCEKREQITRIWKIKKPFGVSENHLMKKFSIVLILLLSISANADAGFITYSGDFTASGLTEGPSSNSGSWSFDFDHSLVTGNASESFNVPLTSLSLSNPTIGSTIFDTSNSSALVFFSSGTVTQINVGSTPPFFLSSSSDGWIAFYNSTGVGYFQSDGGLPSSLTTAPNVTGSFTTTSASVPEPSSMLLGCCSAIGGLIVYRRRRPKQA